MSQVPQCRCLYESQNGLPITRSCFVSCDAQTTELDRRALENLNKLIDNDNSGTD
jgi:hypothetical protein